MMLKGNRVRLRAYEEKDIEAIWADRNDMFIANSANMYPPLPASLHSVREWVMKSSMGHPTQDFRFAIENEQGEYIGGINGAFVDLKNRNLMLGIALSGEKTLNKGYGTEAIGVFLDYCFVEMNMHRVYLGVFSFNPGGIRCYEKCGFRREAVHRNAVFRNGVYHDEIIMGILREEYLGGKR